MYRDEGSPFLFAIAPFMASRASNECSSHAIQQYLNDALSQADAARLEAHLGVCAACRREMETLAADPEFWQTANEVLSDPPDAGARTVEVRQDDTTVLPPQGVRLFIENYLEESSTAEELGVLDGYAVESVIGVGAAGIVLKARDTSLRRHVAIKVLQPTLSGHRSARERFQREAQAMAAVDHTNVIDVYAVSEFRGLPYLVMPLIQGPSLATFASQSAPLPLPQILSLGRQIADGLAAAHTNGLIHRDIKPSNILLNHDCDQVVITDFGLVLASDNPGLTESGVIPGTPQYMSPEQARGDDVTPSTDLFSLGSVLYLLATGCTAFSAGTVYGTLRLISEGNAPPVREANSDVPDFFQRLLKLLHDRNLTQRLGSADRLSKILQQAIAHLTDPSRNELPAELRPAESDKAPAYIYAFVALIAVSIVAICIPKSQVLGPPTTSNPTTPLKPKELLPEPKRFGEPIIYRFREDEPCAYLTAVTIKLPNGSCEIDGLITLQPQRVAERETSLSVDLDLRIETESSQQIYGGVGSGTRRQWQRLNEAAAETVSFGPDGTLQSRSGNIQLPFVDMTLVQLLFPDSEPDAVTPAVDTPEGTNRYIHSVKDGEQSGDHKFGVLTSAVHTGTGELQSVRGDLTVVVTKEFETQRLPVLVSFQRMSTKDADAWRQREAAEVDRKTLLSPPLTAEETALFLSDAADNRNVLSWLQRLERQDPSRYAPEIVDALVLLQSDSDSTCSVLAREIVAGIPEPLLNPFREME